MRAPAMMALILCCGGTVLALSSAAAQSVADERVALARAEAQSRDAVVRSKALEAQAGRQLDDAARARSQEAAVAARIQAAEADIAAAEARVAIVDRLRRAQRARLATAQGPIVRLTAALQMMARRPTAMAIVQPGSLTDLVHVRAVLATMLPAVAARTAGLRAEVVRGERLRELANAAVVTLRDGQDRLARQRLSLARIAADHRRRSRTLKNDAAFEADRAIALGEEARDIVDLMGELDSQAMTRETLAALPGPLPRPARPGLAPPPPAMAATLAARPRYRLPVDGRIVTGLGEVSRAGVRARGLTIATQADAQVVAPAGGRIAYAGAYRGYGRIVIVDHGGGWTSLVTSLDSLAVAVGDTVLQGSPLGRAGPSRPTITVELRRGGEPVDITRLVG